MRTLAILSLVALAACGADGDPVQPQAGLSVGIGANGVHVTPRVSVTKGPISVGLAL